MGGGGCPAEADGRAGVPANCGLGGNMEASGNSGAAVPPHAESGQRHAAHADLVSQMQAEVHRLSELALATIGELQRDAGPVPLKDEALVNPPAEPYNVQARAKGFASELVQSYTALQQLISRIPELPDGEAEQLERIRKLQLRNAELRTELHDAHESGEAALSRAQQIYGVLATHELQQRRV